MAEVEWMTLIGFWAGVVGMLTGIVGAVVSYRSYQRVSKMKSLDLRIEINKMEGDLALHLKKLDKVCCEAKISRPRIAAATGKLRSGEMELWEGEIKKRESEIRDIKKEIGARAKVVKNTPPEELEESLVGLNHIMGQVDYIIREFEGDLSKDEEHRREMRSNIYNR